MAIGEITVGDLPTMSALELTANDYIFIIDDGKFAKKISRPDFFSVVQALVKGEKGDRGAVGATGATGAKGDRGDKGEKGDVGATGQQGIQGEQGVQGFNGWSPVLSPQLDGERRVFYLSSWIGGTGTPPPADMYLSPNGFVSDISLALDVRGMQGLQGIQGEKGADGKDGLDAKEVSSIDFTPTNAIKLTFNDATTTTSPTPNQLLGWASYKDGEYTNTNKLTVNANATVVIPNNAATKIETYLPSGSSSLYNESTQKLNLSNIASCYGVRIRFKVSNSGSASEFINITLDKSTTDIPFSEDKIIRTDSNPQVVDITTQIYSDSVVVSNGLTARLKGAATSNIQIYDVEFVITKLT